MDSVIMAGIILKTFVSLRIDFIGSKLKIWDQNFSFTQINPFLILLEVVCLNVFSLIIYDY